MKNATKNTVSKMLASSVLVAGMAACTGDANENITSAEINDDGISDAGVVPTLVEGNPTCADLGLGQYEKKIDPPQPGTYPLDGNHSVTWSSSDGVVVASWSSELPIDAVIVKGGDGANVYQYDPESMGDGGLVSPDNASGGPAAISHINFCFDYEVLVKKTAQPSLTRTYTWNVDKTADLSQLVLSPGQIFILGYDVVVSVASAIDSGWTVSGQIEVKNPAPVPATITSVADNLAGIGALPVDCGVSFPYQLAPGATLSCSYASALPDGATRLNTATATTTGAVGGGSGTAMVDFAAATINGVDECVDVTDTLEGSLGTVCADEAPKTFSYNIAVGPYGQCGPFEILNVATATTTDSSTSVSDSVTVTGDVPCEGGCSLTQGYWKTHSIHGPAPYDDVWAGKENTAFFLSGQTYYQVLWTAPQGNPYFNLAHQYIAAEMNLLNGADGSAISSTFAAATTLLQTYSPAQVSAMKKNNPVLQQFTQLAGTLDKYNNGLIGPGHCSE